MVKLILDDCIVSWANGFQPSINALKINYGINDMRNKCLDIRKSAWFDYAIDHLINQKFIKVVEDINGLKRIYKGARDTPNHLTYEIFWSY